MLLSFFDVFKFFTEIELTDEMRRYELICVIAFCAVSFASVIVLNIRAKRKNGDKNNGTK